MPTGSTNADCVSARLPMSMANTDARAAMAPFTRILDMRKEGDLPEQTSTDNEHRCSVSSSAVKPVGPCVRRLCRFVLVAPIGRDRIVCSLSPSRFDATAVRSSGVSVAAHATADWTRGTQQRRRRRATHCDRSEGNSARQCSVEHGPSGIDREHTAETQSRGLIRKRSCENAASWIVSPSMILCKQRRYTKLSSGDHKMWHTSDKCQKRSRSP